MRSVAGDDSTFIIFEKTTKNESTIDNSWDVLYNLRNDTKGIKSKRGLSYRTDRASNKDARSVFYNKKGKIYLENNS